MSALVDRIAAVLRTHTPYEAIDGRLYCKSRVCRPTTAEEDEAWDWAAHVAAAVAEALQLTQEWAAYIEDDVINGVICVDESTDDYEYAKTWAAERCRSCDHCRNAQPKFIATRWISGWEKES